MAKYLGIVGFAAILILSACGRSPTQSAATQVPATTAPQSQPDLSQGGFSVVISGDVTGTLTQTNDTADFSKVPNSANGYYVLGFTRADGLVNVQIQFYRSTPPEAGEYTFSLDAVDGSVTAAVYDQSGATPRAFTLGQGTLTLKIGTDNAYEGGFEFTSVGGEPGSQSQNVTVKGAFAKVVLRT